MSAWELDVQESEGAEGHREHSFLFLQKWNQILPTSKCFGQQQVEGLLSQVSLGMNITPNQPSGFDLRVVSSQFRKAHCLTFCDI